MNKRILLAFVFVAFALCGTGHGEPWPIGEPKLTFEQALDLAKARLKMEHDSKHEVLSRVPLKGFIVVTVVYGTEDKPFNRVIFDKIKNQNWGWTFEFAYFGDASVSATIRVVDNKTVQLLRVTT